MWRNTNLVVNHFSLTAKCLCLYEGTEISQVTIFWVTIADKDRYKDRRIPSWVNRSVYYFMFCQNQTTVIRKHCVHFESNAIAENSSRKTKWFTNHVSNLLMSPFIHLGHVEIKNLFTWTCRFNFLRLLESGLSSLVGNDFNEKNLKSWF